MFGFSPESIWRLSLASHRNHLDWLEAMLTHTEFRLFAEWLISEAARIQYDPLETMLDRLIGVPSETVGDEIIGFRSPFYTYYFGNKPQAEHPEAYLTTLEALRTIRDNLREYQPHETLHLPDFLEFIRLHRELGSHITTVRRQHPQDGAINLMTAHKAKGLEFHTVFIVGGIDSAWGERVRSRSRLISYPANLPLAPSGGTYDERLRLFFVAMTRAKQQLIISYALTDELGRGQLEASFLTGTHMVPKHVKASANSSDATQQAELAWHERVTNVPRATMKELLGPQLADYKLSITHLNNLIDLSRGGPAHFLLTNLLRFPQAKSANAAYGTAVHRTLQRAHNHLTATGERRPIEDILGEFVSELHSQHLSPEDEVLFSKKGADSLAAFLRTCYSGFAPGQKTELSFARQGVTIDGALLTGSLDVVTITDNKLTVIDYKTGKPSNEWKGKTDWEKIKLHKYRQQLMFYQLLCQHSRDYAKYTFERGVLQFVEPDAAGRIHALDAHFTTEELADFSKLIHAVWHCITTLDFPDTSEFEPTYKGMLDFEQKLIDKYST